MGQGFRQGYLDSLCSIYGIVNAEKEINKSSEEESQKLFDAIIEYLSKKRILKDVVLGGANHRIISKVMNDIVGERIPYQVTNQRYYKMKDWWESSNWYLTEKGNRVILLSVGGREDHITVVKSMTQRTMSLIDSGAWGGINSIRRSACKILGTYTKNDKYIIYPSQVWYLGKE